jgi:hypothetical protein
LFASYFAFSQNMHCLRIAWTLRKAAAGRTFLARLFFHSPSPFGVSIAFAFFSVHSRVSLSRTQIISLLLLLPTAFWEDRKKDSGKGRLNGLILFWPYSFPLLFSPSSSSLPLSLSHPRLYHHPLLFFPKSCRFRDGTREAWGSFKTRHTRTIISRL